MKKKIIVFLMCSLMIFGLMGCSSDDSSDTSDTSDTYPEETVLIGVELYDPTDSETLALQAYLDYLEENFNVEFKYSEAISDADGEMSFIDDCAIAGCQAFISYYNVTGEEQISAVISYDMYYYGFYDDDSYDNYKDNEYYLGMISSGGDEYDAGVALGEWVLEEGYTNVIYSNGGADYGVGIFVDRQEGFLDTVGDDVEVTIVSGFPGDQFYADQTSALSTEGVEAVVASFNGLSNWAQPIESAGLDDVALATIGSVDDDYTEAFESGSVDFMVSGNIDAYGLGVAIILNALDGNASALEEDDIAINYNTPSWYVTSYDECNALNELLNGDKVYSAEDLKTIIVEFNSDADYQTVVDLADSGAKENIIE